MNMPTLNRKHSRSHSGFTLIEVLVAVVVLSVGLLGLAGLQAVSNKLSRSAYQRSQAVNLAYEIVDAIRANARNAAAYEGSYTPIACNNPIVLTSATNVIQTDLEQWQNHIACSLPSASGEIELVGNLITVTVSWSEDLATGTSSNVAGETGLRDQLVVELQL